MPNNGSNNLTTYYAKRIIGDTAASNETNALLQTGASIAVNTWILTQTNRSSMYGIKYAYDSSSVNDKLELYGNNLTGDNNNINTPTAWVNLHTGDTYILGQVGIGYNPETNGNGYKLRSEGGQVFFNYTTASSTSNTSSQLIISNDNGGNVALELWRGNNASWQIANEGGVFYIRNNYTNAKQNTYSQNGLILDYNTGAASLPYLAVGQILRNTTYKLYVSGTSYFDGAITVAGNILPAVNNTYALGSSSYEWGNTYTRQIYARHFDSSANYTNDKNMYYGYNSGNIHYFYSHDGTTRTQRAYIGATGLVINQHAAGRNAGIIGTYDSTKVALIWSMGTSYNVTADGTSLNNLYGAAYAHTNATAALNSLTYAGGHQFLWCQNGSINVALGNNIWTSGSLYMEGSGIYHVGTAATQQIITFIDSGDQYGTGISIGGGGLFVAGSGESAATIRSSLSLTSGGTETTYITSDGNILFYPGQNSYDAAALITMSAGKIWAGVNGNTTRENQIGVQAGSGQLYMYAQAATSANRGIYIPAHGSGGAKAVVNIDTNNRVYFADSYNGTSTALAYSQSALAASSFTYLTCWNGYELRAVTKSAAADAVDSAHKWVRLAGDTMTGALTCNSGITCNHGVNFMVGGNEVNFIPDGYNNTMWFNYETYNRKANGNVTQYIFGNGKHGSNTATLTCGGVNAQTGSVTAYYFKGYSGSHGYLIAGSNSHQLAMQTDCNLVVYRGGSTAVWSSNTGSSYLMKDNIRNIYKEELQNFDKLRVVNFTYKKELCMEDTQPQYGLIAEEVQRLYPYVVNIPPDYDPTKFDIHKKLQQPYMSIRYEKFVPLLIKKAQLQQEEITELRLKISALEKQLNSYNSNNNL